MQRIYAIGFPSQSHLTAWNTARQTAIQHDHRRVGQQQELFMFHETSPGSVFFLLHGQRIYNTLITWLRHEYRKRGYHEVATPLIYHQQLWQKSGHWEHYRDDMFLIEKGSETTTSITTSSPSISASPSIATPTCLSSSDSATATTSCAHHHHHHHDIMGLKPMNCPGHCLMFASKQRSYRELPMRFVSL